MVIRLNNDSGARDAIIIGALSDFLPTDEIFMIAVIFEVWPHENRRNDYLQTAAALREELEEIDGFISIERFQSLNDPGRILSLSFWRDEKAVLAWRELESHRQAQIKGRSGIFADYHLRVAEVIRDYGMYDRDQAPDDSKMIHDQIPLPPEPDT
jgi:heme-degrading monooxygenase HmoA